MKGRHIVVILIGGVVVYFIYKNATGPKGTKKGPAGATSAQVPGS